MTSNPVTCRHDPDSETTARTSRDGSRRVTDERINVYTHLAGVVLALFGSAHLIVSASMAGKPWHIVGFSIYGCALILLFACSVLHHGIHGSKRLIQTFRTLDYLAIYLLIAGTITPVTLVLIRSAFGWTVFGVTWTVALAGILLRSVAPGHRKGLSNTLYLATGWLTVMTAFPVWRASGLEATALLALGGLAYSLGAVIFALEKPNPVPGRFGFHEIWHLAVMGGAALHYVFMLRHVLPFH